MCEREREFVCVCVCVSNCVLYKRQQLGDLSPIWTVTSQKNNPAIKYSLTPKLIHWFLSKAIISSIEFCSNKNACILSA